MYDPSAPPLVSETLLKSRRTLDELSHRRSVTVKVQNKVHLNQTRNRHEICHTLIKLAIINETEKASCERRGCAHQKTGTVFKRVQNCEYNFIVISQSI